MSAFAFLASVFVISFSGAAAPGPVTTVSLRLGMQNKYAGLALAAGHALVEIPLIFLIVTGLGGYLKTEAARVILGIAGGAVLVFMGISTIRTISRANIAETPDSPAPSRGALTAGFILSVVNPFFMVWWATVGLKLASKALTYGLAVFAGFIAVHLLTDVIVCQSLSLAGFTGAKLMGRWYRIVVAFCGAALIFFGLFFFYDAANLILTAPD